MLSWSLALHSTFKGNCPGDGDGDGDQNGDGGASVTSGKPSLTKNSLSMDIARCDSAQLWQMGGDDTRWKGFSAVSAQEQSQRAEEDLRPC